MLPGWNITLPPSDTNQDATIYLTPDQYRSFGQGDPNGVSLVAHELTHVQQYQDGITISDMTREYIRTLSHDNSLFEQAADKVRQRVYTDLTSTRRGK